MIKTVTVQIGNSDDGLRQELWARFVHDTKVALGDLEKERHFFASSPGDSVWQNACWVIEIELGRVDALKTALAKLAKTFKQNSIAVTIGDTELVAAEGK